ncbi:MAG: sigma 54-interacting transcriptional regulator [Deltaproteobacteria bacterium]|nr:sigma 54-interacting transcriptional regulator [Deltaproteobacteria bacterium]
MVGPVSERGLETTIDAGRSGGGAGEGDLLLVAGPGHLITHPLQKPELVIGRAPECDVVIDHRALSRRHALLRVKPLGVQDLNSTNGTRVGAKVLAGGDLTGLETGESFHIGPFSFMVIASRAEQRSDNERDRLVVDDPTPAGATELIRTIARSGASVLIQGETGVGKDVLAHTIHELSGRTGPLCRINCAALSESLLESELFGHEKGAFTGAVAARAGLLESAEGGSVFLDEVGELPLAIQAKLLRAVEAREVIRLGSTKPIHIDVRFITATNRDLPVEVSAGRFRHDLFFRIDGVSLRIPPLRDRDGAVAKLALKFIAEAAARSGKPVRATPALLPALEAYDWPGNVRELRAVIERAVLLASTGELAPHHLAFSPRAEAPRPPAPAATPAPPPAAPAAAEDVDLSFLTAEQREDRERVVAALRDCVGNQTRAAKLLGISRTTLVNKLGLYRIPRPRT